VHKQRRNQKIDIAPDFNLTDVNGNSLSLYDTLDEGHSVMRWTPSLGQDRDNIKVGSRYPQGGSGVKDSAMPPLLASTWVEVNTAKNIAKNIPFLCHQRDARIIGI